MVEFSLLAPIIFLLLIGLADVARAVYYYNIISNSSREGAREAILAYDQCQNTGTGGGSCSSPPGTDTSLVGVEQAMTRAGGGIVNYVFAEASSDTSVAPSCTPTVNKGCVWVFIVQGKSTLTTGCTPPNPLPAPGTDNSGQMQPCDFNQAKQSGGHDVIVEIEYNFAPLTPLVGNVMGNKIVMWAKSEMRTEY